MRSNLSLVVLLLILGLLGLAVLARLQRGLLGLILAGILVILGFYWFREVRRALEGSKQLKRYPVEVYEGDGLISVTAEVPGPENEVSFEVSENKVLLRGGGGFRKRIKLPCKVKLLESSYVNGILHLRLVKADMVKSREMGG
jgi:HSP20 family molecular chaperone IbpA